MAMKPHPPRVRRNINATPANMGSACGDAFRHRAERYRLGGSPVSYPVCWTFECMEEFMIQRWDSIFFLGTRWLNEPQPINDRLWDWAFNTVRGGVYPAEIRLRTRFVGVVDVWKSL